MTTNTGQGYQSCLEPATGVEPAYPAWEAGGLPLTYAGVVPGCAPAGGGVIALQGIPFFPVKNGQKLPRPSALIFTSAAPHPTRKAHCSALGLVAGFRPPRPRLSGVPIRGVIEVWVSRIEPSGQGISPEPCTTHGFGIGGTGRTRTGDALPYGAGAPAHSAVALPSELLSHITAGHGSIPAGGLCLLSALDRLGDSHFWHRTRMRPGGRGGIRTRG